MEQGNDQDLAVHHGRGEQVTFDSDAAPIRRSDDGIIARLYWPLTG